MNLMRRQRVMREGRIQVSLPESVRIEHGAELRGFVRYCTLRIERELGALEWWTVVVVPRVDVGYASTVIVRDRGTTIEARSAGADAMLTVWNAMCRIEQPLRDSCARTRARSRAACAELA